MRDSGNTYYISSGKSHLVRLPALTVESPRVENPSKRLLMLIPLTRTTKGFDYVKEAGLIGGIWARHSWLTHTDAVPHGIEIKFYIEDVLKDDVMPILEANRIDEKEVIFFDGSSFENDSIPRLVGKKLASFIDPRFQEYDWIFVMDCDIFALSPDERKISFFERFFEGCIEGVIGNLYAMVRGIGIPPNWVSRFGDLDEVPFDEAQAIWRQMAETVVNPEVVNRFWDKGVDTIIAGGAMHAYPAKAIMQNTELLKWFHCAAQVMQDDEAVIALYHAMGNPVWDLRERVKFNEVMVGPTIVGSDYDDFKEFINADEPFIFHYSMNPVEFFFRSWIGALE